MLRFALFPLVVLACLASENVAAQIVEMPLNERVQVRAYGLWWLSYSRRENLARAADRADHYYEEDKQGRAESRYERLARYGDKFAQFRLGLLALEREEVEDAWAWFTLANEGGTHKEFADYPDQVWRALDAEGRARAQQRLGKLAESYSDYALARQVRRIFRNQLRSSTGSRLGFTEALPVTIVGGMDARQFYNNLALGYAFSDQLIKNYGEVTLGEFRVLEEDEAGPED